MIHKNLSHIQHTPVLHIVIGAFDGVHLAHQQLIKLAIENAKSQNQKSMIFSFTPLPKEYLLGEHFSGALSTHPRRHELLKQMEADYTVLVDFESIKELSEKQFIEILLSKTDKLVLYSGNDFRMGASEGTSYDGDRVTKIQLDDIFINGDICRSSHIRELISTGEIERANTLLGKDYSIISHSVSGDKIGRSINFPTINIQPNKQITPQSGVYFGEIKVYNETYPTAIYVGKRPTLQGLELRIESHIVSDFLYEEILPQTPIEVSFIKRIGEEKSFKSLAELKEMLYNYKIISLGLATERYK